MVWTNAWGLADLDDPRGLTPEARDPRERAWFDAAPTLGHDIADKVPGSAPVYDLVLLWGPGRTWGEDGDDTLPEPDEVWTPGWSVDDVVEEIEDPARV